MARKTTATARTRRYERLDTPEKIALVASPVRQDIVDTLESLGGEADIATVAAQMGRPADGLYYHFELLARGGLLQRIDAEGGSRRYRIGRARGAALRLEYRVPAEGRAAIGRVVDRALGAARRDFHAALADPGTVVAGPRRELWAGRNQGWVDAEGLAEINRLITRLQQVLQGPRRAGCDRLVSVSFALAPLKSKAVRRR